jgi:hypothetical protein
MERRVFLKSMFAIPFGSRLLESRDIKRIPDLKEILLYKDPLNLICHLTEDDKMYMRTKCNSITFHHRDIRLDCEFIFNFIDHVRPTGFCLSYPGVEGFVQDKLPEMYDDSYPDMTPGDSLVFTYSINYTFDEVNLRCLSTKDSPQNGAVLQPPSQWSLVYASKL